MTLLMPTTAVLRDEVEKLGIIGLVGGLLNDALPEHEPATVAQPFVFNKYHLAIHPTAGIENWLRIGNALQGINIGYQWWVGDWLAFGEAKFADKVEQGMEFTGRTENTLRQWAWTAKRFAPEERTHEVSFGHYHTMASVKNKAPDVAMKLLANAEAKGLPVQLVRQQVKEYNLHHDPDYGRYHANAPSAADRGLTPAIALMQVLQDYFEGVTEETALIILADLRFTGFDIVEGE